MREPGRASPSPVPSAGREVEGTDEDTSQRYLALAALKAPLNLPQHGLEFPMATCARGSKRPMAYWAQASLTATETQILLGPVRHRVENQKM